MLATLPKHENEGGSVNDLKTRRKAAGLSTPELARRAGCSSSAIYQIEYGNFNPSDDMKRRIERGLKGIRTKTVVSYAKREG